ncbi:MAG: hypothetical protein CVU88_00315 [Firmicutes bacterium HGW-Firmicutes-13]|nr:MAG: hypothetical protein CVU88_00315 [Firmicutes bacterium HGW-Firmicutes-13]
MFIEAFFSGLLCGWLRGGTINNLTQQPLRLLPLAAAAFLLQRVLNIGIFQSSFLIFFVPYFHMLSYFFLFIFLFQNRKLPGIKVMGTGIFLNFLVIAFNGGAMPVSPVRLTPEVIEFLMQGGDPLHTIVAAQTRLVFLADIIPVHLPTGGYYLSIGDIILALGLFYFLQKCMRKKRRRQLTPLKSFGT